MVHWEEAVSGECMSWFAGRWDPSCFPEGLLQDVLGQKSALQRKHVAVLLLAGWDGDVLRGLPSSLKVVPLIPPGCALGSSSCSPSFVVIYL